MITRATRETTNTAAELGKDIQKVAGNAAVTTLMDGSAHVGYVGGEQERRDEEDEEVVGKEEREQRDEAGKTLIQVMASCGMSLINYILQGREDVLHE